ncbi:protein CROWDED NUCLEI 1 [Morus notabilis]|uniref:protein CROWDED NUCLEI 1 n=1 Tax=Morus notabilis TaxID=981085 RepID=UPI000CED4391|nr:protein CROWDED NUCLEI 1 [Morus notabilis]XP_024022318.1 protein CROWDED NUCLEI 1 [Morus notabilis]
MMFTPQKVWSGWSLTPRTGAHKSGTGSGPNQNSIGDAAKGKGIALGEAATPPPSGFAVENGGNALMGSGQPAADRDGLTQSISQIENELFEYQYNMGLLLIEKKEWTSKYEELRQGLDEAKDALKREQAAHLIALSDVEKREENLRKALGVEKQCVLDLEKALREIRAENAEIKYTADSKLAEANSLVTSIEEKSLELEAKLRAADAKLAEVSRKSSEIERKSHDLEARESSLRRDRLSFVEEQRVHESNLSKQKEDLREWERKLQEGEERLAKGQIILNQREERANENDRTFKQKQKGLEDAQKKIDESNAILKSKEEDIGSRIANLTLKEKEYDALRISLEMKEKEFLLLEEKLDARERVEIQKLTDEHNAILEEKKREFELEIDQKRKSLDDELKNKVVDVEKKEAEINHKEEKLSKREQALEKKWEKFREKEKDHETKLKTLKEREKSVKSEEKNLEKEKKEMLADKEELLGIKAEVEKIRAENEEQLQNIIDERDRLKVSEEERSEYRRLQSELKQEIDKYMQQKELLLKEADDLKQQKEVFEREWEELDEKRAEIEKELKNLREQKEEFEKLKEIEEERLKNEKAAAQDHIRREQEELNLARESFSAYTEHEKTLLAEKEKSERSQMIHDYEVRKRELETDMQNRLEEIEKPLREKEKSFEEERKRELDNINYLRDVARRDMEELKFERLKIEKERHEADTNKEHLERHRVEIRKDIEELFDLSNKLKDQREQFIKERERFISFVDELKGCNNCSEIVSEFVLSDLRSLVEIENVEVLPMPKLADYAKGGVIGDLAASKKPSSDTFDPKSPVSGGTMSWLRKCTTKIFKLSPGKKSESTSVRNLAEEEPFLGEHNLEEPPKKVLSSEIEAELSFAAASDSFDVQASIRETEAGQDPSADDVSNINSQGPEAPEDSQPSDLKGEKKRPRRGKGKVSRTLSVEAVVEDAKALLGEDLKLNDGGYQNGNAEDSANTNAGSQGGSIIAEKKPFYARKRGRPRTSQATVSEHDGYDSEERSEAGRRKRMRDKVPTVEQAPAERRYNLRRPKSQDAAAPVKASRSKENQQQVTDEAGLSSIAAPASSRGFASENGGSLHLVRCTTVANTEDGFVDATKNMVENTALSEEVNGTPERGREYADGDDYRSESQGDDASNVEDEDEDDDEESQHPGEVSIGKKLWTFLTT